MAVYLFPPYEDHDNHVTDRVTEGIAQCLTPWGPQAGKGTEAVWPGSGGHATGRGEGRLTRQHRVLQGLLGHHVGKTAEDGLQGVAKLHQVLGLPGQAVLLTASGQGSPRGAEGAWGERGQVGSLLSGLEGAPLSPTGRDRGPLTLVGETGGPALPTGSSWQRSRCAPTWSTGLPVSGGAGVQDPVPAFLSKVVSDLEHRGPLSPAEPHSAELSSGQITTYLLSPSSCKN